MVEGEKEWRIVLRSDDEQGWPGNLVEGHRPALGTDDTGSMFDLEGRDLHDAEALHWSSLVVWAATVRPGEVLYVPQASLHSARSATMRTAMVTTNFVDLSPRAAAHACPLWVESCARGEPRILGLFSKSRKSTSPDERPLSKEKLLRDACAAVASHCAEVEAEVEAEAGVSGAGGRGAGAAEL